MTTVRRQVTIDAQQDEKLRRLAAMFGVTEGDVIRQAIERHINMPPVAKRDLAAWHAERNFIQQRIQPGATHGQRHWRREDLYER